MDAMMLNKRLFRCEIYTESFRIEGKLEPMGEIVTALGDKRRSCMPVYDAIMTPISAHNPLNPITIPQLVINKNNVVFVSLLDPADYEDVRLAPNVVVMTVYAGPFAIRGEFHLGGEMRVRDFVDTLTLDYTPITNVRFFPLVPTKASFTPSCPFVVLNKNLISAYCGEEAEDRGPQS